MSLDGKVAIVTGGNSGIGQAIVLEFARQHADVIIDYVCHPEATEALERQVGKLGDRSIGVEADVSKLADLQMLVDKAVSQFGRLDIMVNNAGVETRTSILDTTEDQYDRVMAINLKSAFFGTQIAAKQMIKQAGGGRIINISSVHEDWPMPGNTAYCLSKGGMRMLTRTAGVELARHNILVVGVGPGAVATPINVGTMHDAAKLAQLDNRWGAWRARRRSPRWSALLPATAPAIFRQPRFSQMAASCTAARVCSGDPPLAAPHPQLIDIVCRLSVEPRRPPSIER